MKYWEYHLPVTWKHLHKKSNHWYLGTFMNPNVTFDQKSRVFKAKNNGHQNFTYSLGVPNLALI